MAAEIDDHQTRAREFGAQRSAEAEELVVDAQPVGERDAAPGVRGVDRVAGVAIELGGAAAAALCCPVGDLFGIEVLERREGTQSREQVARSAAVRPIGFDQVEAQIYQ